MAHQPCTRLGQPQRTAGSLRRATSPAGPARLADRDAAIMDWYRRLAGVRVEEGSPAMAVTIRPSWSDAGVAANR